jgi:hypothetical protein
MPTADYRSAARHIPLSLALASAGPGIGPRIPLPIFRKNYLNQVGLRCNFSAFLSDLTIGTRSGETSSRGSAGLAAVDLVRQCKGGDGCRDFAVLGGSPDRRVGLRRVARPFPASIRSMMLRACDRSKVTVSRSLESRGRYGLAYQTSWIHFLAGGLQERATCHSHHSNGAR